ncbi:hypothetical protein [Halobacteriovorax marinus]|uniref:hypothetical protein n=1 Tax=Halobacteriovorax marinus TaxID=97084 RepID=UPI003A932335
MKSIILLFLFSFSSFGAITEKEFNEVPNRILHLMKEEISASGLDISLNLNWSSETKNAGANRRGYTGLISLYGGYARLTEVTPQSFALTTCHELAHLIAEGIRVMPTLKYASESESDYFATKTCLRKYLREYPTDKTPTQWQKSMCEESSSSETTLCHDLLITARESLAVDNALTKNDHWDDYTKLDQTISERTLYNGYASVGCRYTSYVAGALGRARPSCWHHKSSPLSVDEYLISYEYPEAMFVGEIKNLVRTNFGCHFQLSSIDFFRQSILSPLSMGDVSGKKIYSYSDCKLDSSSSASGTLSLFKGEIYLNLEARDK